MPRTTRPRAHTLIRKSNGYAEQRFRCADGSLKTVSLGPWGGPAGDDPSDQVLARRAEVIEQWTRAGYHWPPQSRPISHAAAGDDETTVGELIVEYMRHAASYYGTTSSRSTYGEHHRVCRLLLEDGSLVDLPADRFSPMMLRAFRARVALLKARAKSRKLVSRQVVNKYTSVVVRIFRWGVSMQLLEPGTLAALQAVEPIGIGRPTAPGLAVNPEQRKIRSVPIGDVRKAMERMAPMPRAMATVQLLAGMRPVEVCRMRLDALRAQGDELIYTPSPDADKLAHQRSVAEPIILTEPIAAHLRPWLKLARRERREYVFTPRASRRHDNAIKCRASETRFPSNHPDAQRAKRIARGWVPALTPTPDESPWRVDCYGQHVRRSCDEAGVDRWSPNQLRHLAATIVANLPEHAGGGKHRAQMVLRHASITTTEGYVDRTPDAIGARALSEHLLELLSA